jgi:hypothetical protein
VDPDTVLSWLVEAADHAAAFSQYCLHMTCGSCKCSSDELFTLLGAVKEGEVSEAEAIQRLWRFPIECGSRDPVTKLLLMIDVGDRMLATAQFVVHQSVHVWAPDCAPLFLTDGFKEQAIALLIHYGQWVYPARRQAKGPAPKPRWMPSPELCYAQVVK